jgi:hypothetical protein
MGDSDDEIAEKAKRIDEIETQMKSKTARVKRLLQALGKMIFDDTLESNGCLKQDKIRSAENDFKIMILTRRKKFREIACFQPDLLVSKSYMNSSLHPPSIAEANVKTARIEEDIRKAKAEFGNTDIRLFVVVLRA